MLSVIWLLFAAVMVAAVVIDVVSYRIPNSLVLGLGALFFVAAALNWGEVAWTSHVAAAILVFGAGVFLYAMNQMGAGDVKLLGVVALWAGIDGVIPLLLYVSVCGLLGMLVIVVVRMIAPRIQTQPMPGKPSLPRVLTKGQGIPYAIAIGPGAIIASFSFSQWLWRL